MLIQGSHLGGVLKHSTASSMVASIMCVFEQVCVHIYIWIKCF